MTSTNVKAMVAKMFTVGFLAAAVVLIAPAKAEAQWSVGVRVGAAPYYGQAYGRPVVVAPAPVYGYYGRGYEEERREAFYRHEREEREEHFDRDRDWDRRRRFAVHIRSLLARGSCAIARR